MGPNNNDNVRRTRRLSNGIPFTRWAEDYLASRIKTWFGSNTTQQTVGELDVF